MKQGTFWLSIGGVVLVSLAVAVFGVIRPVAHWDIIGYVASALKFQGLSGEALHQQTYEIIRAAYDPATFALLVETPQATGHGAYRYTVYSDPVALEQQLPFYQIRVAYIALLNLLAPVAGGLPGAAQLVSAVCAGAITFIAGLMLMRGPRALPPLVAVAVLPLVVAAAGAVSAGRVESPDTFAALMALLALVLLDRHRLAALCLIALLPLVRTDGVLLAGFVLLLLLWEGERRWLPYTLIACAFVVYFLVNHLSGNYGHLVLFNFTLLNGAPDPYPATMEVARDLGTYVKFYFYMLIKFSFLLLTLGLMALLILVDLRREGKVSPLAVAALIAVAYVITHFLLFPLGSTRHYVFALTLIFIAAVQILYHWVRTPPAP